MLASPAPQYTTEIPLTRTARHPRVYKTDGTRKESVWFTNCKAKMVNRVSCHIKKKRY